MLLFFRTAGLVYSIHWLPHVAMFIISILGDFNLVSTTLPLCLCKHCAGFTSGVMCHLQ